MGLEDRIRRLEQLAAERCNPARPQPVPEAWLERLPDGRLRGPVHDEVTNPGQLATFCAILTMEAAGPIADAERRAIREQLAVLDERGQEVID